MEHQFKKPEHPGKRFGGYGLGKHAIEVLVVVNEDEFTPEEHDKLGAMACRGVMAAIGELRHGDKAPEILSRIRFYFTDPNGQPIRGVGDKWKGWVDRIYESITLGVNLLLGAGEYDKEFLPAGPEDDDHDFTEEDVMAEYRKCVRFPGDPSKIH